MFELRSGLLACVFAAVLGVSAHFAAADTIYVGLPYHDVTVTGFQDGAVAADLAGQQKLFPINTVDQIELDGQDTFNAAEKARKAKDWTTASELYPKAVNQAHRGIKQVVEARALIALDNTGRYLEAIKYFLDIYETSPTAATYELRPQKLPDASSAFLGEAADLIQSHLGDTSFKKPEAQTNLKTMMLEIYTQAKSPKAAALSRELGLGGPAEPAPAAAVVEAAPTVAAQPDNTNLSTVRDALAGHQYEAAIRQADAQLGSADGESAVQLYLAQGQAYAALNKPEDAEAAYLRVAIHYPMSPEAPNALLAAAELEKASNPDGAKRLYKEILDRYPASVAANRAKGNV